MKNEIRIKEGKMEAELESLFAKGDRLITERHNSTRLQVRSLTEEEIISIVEALPLIPCILPEIQRDEWVGRITEVIVHLRKIKLHPKAINKYKEELVNKFYGALIHPGAPVGLAAADAAGTNTTQMTLNTFHVAGSATNAAFGIKVIREILDLLNRSMKSCRIIYEEHMSFERIMVEKRPELVEVRFFDLISEANIEEMPQVIPDWYSQFIDIYDRDVITPAKHYLRVVLNADHLYSFHITPYKVYQAMKDAALKDTQMTILYSPTIQNVIEFHFIPNEAKIEGGDSLTYLRTQLGAINTRRIQGLTGIKGIFVNRVSLVKLFEREVLVPGSNVYRLYFNPYINKLSGVRSDSLIRFVQFAGFSVIGKHGDHLEVEAKDSPLTILRKLIEDDESEQLEYETNKRKEKLERAVKDKQAAREISILRDPTEIELIGYTHFIETDGGILDEVLDLEGIDKEATYSNDIRETFSHFGIEAARDLITKEIDQVFRNSKQPLERASVVLMADYMTVKGFLTPFNLSGTAAHNIGVFSKSTLQKPVDYFAAEALSNGIDHIKTASACILTGKKPNLSTGIVKIIYEQKEEDYDNFAQQDFKELPPAELVNDEEDAAKLEEANDRADRKDDPEAGEALKIGQGVKDVKEVVPPKVVPSPKYPAIVKVEAPEIEGRARLMLQNHIVEYEEEHPLVHIKRKRLFEDLFTTMKNEVGKYGQIQDKYLREAMTAWLVEQKMIDEREQDPVFPYTDKIDYAFVKRMMERKIKKADAENIAKLLGSEVKEIVDALTILKKKSSLFTGEVISSYNTKTRLWEYIFTNGETETVSIPKQLKEKLEKSYTGEKSERSRRIFSLLMRYDLLFGTGYQGAIPEGSFNVLDSEYEAFASPLNHTLENYYSLYIDTDIYFASKGSFFHETNLEGGSYELNPPFLESVILATTNKILQALTDTKIYTFMLVLPAWTDLLSYKLLIESKYNKLHNKVIVLKAKEHKYRNVAEGKEWMHGVDSFIFVLSNRTDKKQFGIQFEGEIRKSFK